jgi:hypothetical protein
MEPGPGGTQACFEQPCKLKEYCLNATTFSSGNGPALSDSCRAGGRAVFCIPADFLDDIEKAGKALRTVNFVALLIQGWCEAGGRYRPR